jgi:hypothetical protein
MSSPKQWLNIGIETSCKIERELYFSTKVNNNNNNNNNLRQYYKTCGKILSKVINEAGRLSYNNKITI